MWLWPTWQSSLALPTFCFLNFDGKGLLFQYITEFEKDIIFKS